METLFRFVFYLMTETEETQSEQSNQDAKEKDTFMGDDRSKYHLISSEPKRGHMKVAQAIIHTKKINLYCLILWTPNLPNKLIKKHKNDEDVQGSLRRTRRPRKKNRRWNRG